jgi:hypothetical protein
MRTSEGVDVWLLRAMSIAVEVSAADVPDNRPLSGRFTGPGSLKFCRYLRSLYPASVRIAIICDNFSPHLSTCTNRRVGSWATTNNAEIARTSANSSWLNRIEAQFTALRYFTLDGTDHASHTEQGTMLRRYIIWRNSTPTTNDSAAWSSGQT